jgi:hypothetical protein
LTVHPVPIPTPIIIDDAANTKEENNNQNETLFKRGNAISNAPIKLGKNKLPNPPNIAGITKKNIINIACTVITLLYNVSGNANICF